MPDDEDHVQPRIGATKTRRIYAAINISAGHEFWVKIKNDKHPKYVSKFPPTQIPLELHSSLYIPYMKISQHIDNNMPSVATLVSLCRHRCTTTRSLVTRRNPIPFMFLWRKIFRVLQYFPQP